jgi:hypothetical protein
MTSLMYNVLRRVSGMQGHESSISVFCMGQRKVGTISAEIARSEERSLSLDHFGQKPMH